MNVEHRVFLVKDSKSAEAVAQALSEGFSVISSNAAGAAGALVIVARAVQPVIEKAPAFTV